MKENKIEEIVSMILGLVIVFLVVGMVFNVFQKKRGVIDLAGISVEPTPEVIAEPTGDLEKEVEYVVQPGDNLWKIAVIKYQNGYQWLKIARENNLKNPDVLYVGMKLKMPKIEISTTIAQTNKSTIETGRDYRVVKNDSLWKIAVNMYGDGYLWTKIWKINRQKIHDPNKLEIGMVLMLE